MSSSLPDTSTHHPHHPALPVLSSDHVDNISTTDQGSDHVDQEAEVVEEQDATGEVRHELHDCFILETVDLVEVADEEDPGDAEEESKA